MSLQIRRFPDSILKKPARSVSRIDVTVRKFIQALIVIMRAQPRCVGLAAPQIGSSYRIAVMDASNHPKVKKAHGLLILINPTFVELKGQVIQREGCLSVPDFTGDVRRFERVRVRAQDYEGHFFEVTLEGFEGIIAQHEVDHLDGKLFLDRVSNPRTDIYRRKKYL